MTREWIPYLPRPSRIRAAMMAITRPAAIDLATIDRVTKAFGLSFHRQRNVKHNRRSRNLIIDTDHGRVVLKRYRPEWLPETVTCVHSTLTRLEELGRPGPRLLRTPEGKDWLNDGTSVYAMFAFIKGTSYAGTYLLRKDRLWITAKAAKLLGDMHDSLADFTPTGSHHHGIEPESRLPRRDMAWHAAMVDELIARADEIADDDGRELALRLGAHSAKLLDTLARLDSALMDAQMPTTVIHGDFGIHNLIFNPSAQPIPIDFELSRLDWRVNDLISALGKHRFNRNEYDFESMRTFMAEYDRRFPLADRERELFAEAWAHYKLRAAVQYWNSYHLTEGPARKLRSALDSIAQARWVLDNPDPIHDLARR